MVTVLRVPPELAGMRLDRFVQGELKRTSRTRAKAIIERGCFSPDARALRPNHRVRAEERVLLWRAPWDDEPPDVDLRVLYEDADLLAIDKPANLPVHPTARYYKSTVVKVLEAARPDEHFRLSHRLDRETSGALLLAKNAEADRIVKIQFEARETVKKAYVAITWGAPNDDQLRVELPLELDPTHKTKLKMRVAMGGGGLDARTAFEVIERRTSASGKRYALMRCHLETGRQHQIRVHLASIGLPIVGDKLYGPDDALFMRGADGALTDDDRATLEMERHALHAERLTIEHPRTGEPVVIEAPLADDMRAFWSAIGA